MLHFADIVALVQSGSVDRKDDSRYLGRLHIYGRIADERAAHEVAVDITAQLPQSAQLEPVTVADPERRVYRLDILYRLHVRACRGAGYLRQPVVYGAHEPLGRKVGAVGIGVCKSEYILTHAVVVLAQPQYRVIDRIGSLITLQHSHAQSGILSEYIARRIVPQPLEQREVALALGHFEYAHQRLAVLG